ncbi:hypothetical protein [Fuerstiella marisgermanici]|uniref:Uncharacterized protein n=1 Tax=Fuerstiella marisgermanici TaxID=1891926 RepID=A0A1P8WCD9_9PLAN|nr:hypothetical protein [Fuerstiella marisgermanici]APZ91714.1 hypothetical protein Fuma_01305 [Fuerstiella marisgermanici]
MLSDSVDESGDEPSSNEPAGETDLHAQKRRILIWLLVWSAIMGVVAMFEDETQADPVVDLLLGLPFVILGIYWCRTDAAERGHYIGVPMSACLVLMFVLGLPIYLFQTRGLKGILSLGWLLLYLIAMAASLIAGAVVTSVVATGEFSL